VQVRLDGHTLTIPGLVSIATGAAGITVDPAALQPVEHRHLRASTIIAALSFLALRSNPEAYHPHGARHPRPPAPGRGRPHPGRSCRWILPRTADPGPVRAAGGAVGHRPALHAAESLTTAVTAEINAAAELLAAVRALRFLPTARTISYGYVRRRAIPATSPALPARRKRRAAAHSPPPRPHSEHREEHGLLTKRSISGALRQWGRPTGARQEPERAGGGRRWWPRR
jgi:hypothetical protein